MTAAAAGSRRQARTLLVSAGDIGGDCTFTGCVPSKTLIESAGRGQDFSSAIGRVHEVVAAVAAADAEEIERARGVTALRGTARLRSPREVEVEGRTYRAPRIVLATGSRPAVPPVTGLDGVDYLTNENVFDLARPPASLAVLGGGYTGCELAQAMARLGVSVTVVEAADRLLPGEDADAGRVLATVFAGEGIEIRTGQPVKEVAAEGTEAVRLLLADGDAVRTERVLVAAGRVPDTDAVGLEAAGVRTGPGGRIVTDDRLATGVPGIYATGDVTGTTPLTHAAREMSEIAVANAFSRWGRARFRASLIPRVAFTDPEVAAVGMSEAGAAARGGRVAYQPLAEVDRAVAAGKTDGFVKLLTGPRPLLGRLGGGRVLGATVVAERGGELIHEASLAMRTRMFAGRLAQATHAYPTWSLAMQLAAGQFFREVGGRRAYPARE